jgi:type IX secretion system PorP/SprF family membrane protein
MLWITSQSTRFFVLIAMCKAAALFGQQLPQSSVYWLNPVQFHTAAVGNEQTLVATGSYRKQWSQFAGAPVTQQLNVHAPIDFIRSGVGLRIQHDANGAHRVTTAALAYRYAVIQNRRFTLSAGLGFGYAQYNLDGTALRAPDGTYNEQTGVIVHNDDYLPESGIVAGAMNLEAGLWLQSKRLEAGLTLQNAYAQSFRYTQVVDVTIQRPQHINFYTGYQVPYGKIRLKPCVMVQSDLKKTQTHLALEVGFDGNLFAAFGLRGLGVDNVESMTFLVGGRINPNLVVIYAFDNVLLPFKTSSTGSHELVLRYTLSKNLGSGKLPPIIYNPRYL